MGATDRVTYTDFHKETLLVRTTTMLTVDLEALGEPWWRDHKKN